MLRDSVAALLESDCSLAALVQAFAEACPAAVTAADTFDGRTPLQLLSLTSCRCNDASHCPCGGMVPSPPHLNAEEKEKVLAVIQPFEAEFSAAEAVENTVALLSESLLPSLYEPEGAPPPADDLPFVQLRLHMRLAQPLLEALSAEGGDLMGDSAAWLEGIAAAAASVERLEKEQKAAEEAAAAEAAAAASGAAASPSAAAEQADGQQGQQLLPRKQRLRASKAAAGPAGGASGSGAAPAAAQAQQRLELSAPGLHEGTLGFVSQALLWPDMDASSDCLQRVVAALREAPPGGSPSDAPFVVNLEVCDVCGLSGEAGVFGCGWLRCGGGCASSSSSSLHSAPVAPARDLSSLLMLPFFLTGPQLQVEHVRRLLPDRKSVV